jgi:hypothetical protein
MGIVRMVKPWREWMFIFLAEPGKTRLEREIGMEEYERRVREFIDDDTVEVKIKHVAKWFINEIVAERYSEGNVYVAHCERMWELLTETDFVWVMRCIGIRRLMGWGAILVFRMRIIWLGKLLM